MNILITGAGGSVLSAIVPQLQQMGSKIEKVYFTDMSSHNALKVLVDFDELTDSEFIQVPKGESTIFYDFMKNIIKSNNITHVIPLVDEELLNYCKLYGDGIFNSLCAPKNFKFIRMCLDKNFLMNVLGMNNFNVPRTIRIGEEVKKPLIVKPKKGHGSKNIYYVNSELELNLLIGLIRYDDYLVQERIFGTEYTIFCYKDIVVIKEIIEKKGITISAKTIKNDKIADICKRVYTHFDPKGPINIQGILDYSDNEFKIFEINPRISTSTILSLQAGINEIKTGFGIDNKSEYKEDVYMYRYYTQVFKE